MDPIPAPSASNNTTASTSSITGVALLMMKKDQAGRPAALLPLRLSLKRVRSESDPCETVTGGELMVVSVWPFWKRRQSARRDR